MLVGLFLFASTALADHLTFGAVPWVNDDHDIGMIFDASVPGDSGLPLSNFKDRLQDAYGTWNQVGGTAGFNFYLRTAT